MIFQKSSGRVAEQEETEAEAPENRGDEVETVVGPSVNVEGDFVSEGNIIVKGTVTGSVRTSRFLSVEAGARIVANVVADSARVAGEIKGNLKIKESLELTATARVVGDVMAQVLKIDAGALLYGKVIMPGLEAIDGKSSFKTARGSAKKNVEETLAAE